jgi:hypothetical protein
LRGGIDLALPKIKKRGKANDTPTSSVATIGSHGADNAGEKVNVAETHTRRIKTQGAVI